MHTGFVSSVGNEAVLKALFKFSDVELTFHKGVEVALETEDVAKVARETVHGSKATATPAPISNYTRRRHHQCRREPRSFHTHFQRERALGVERQVSLQKTVGSSTLSADSAGGSDQCLQKKKGKELVAYIVEEELIQLSTASLAVTP